MSAVDDPLDAFTDEEIARAVGGEYTPAAARVNDFARRPGVCLRHLTAYTDGICRECAGTAKEPAVFRYWKPKPWERWDD
jgi:hypothetical protein